MDGWLQKVRQESKLLQGERTELSELIEKEVYGWYAIFYRWTRGLCEPNESEVEPIYVNLSHDFRVLLTSGVMVDREAYWKRLVSLYAARRGDPPSHILNLEMLPVGPDHMLVTFDLFKKGVLQKKFDSALMRRNPALAAGVEWVYVHESDHTLDSPPRIP